MGYNFGFRRRRRRASAPTPPAFWLGATLHSRAGVGQSISDTDKLDGWLNDGTVSGDWVGTTTARPTYSATSLGGKPGLTFDGSNDQLANTLRANQVLATAVDDGAWGGTIAAVVRFSALPSVGTRRDFLSVPHQGYGPLQVRNVAGVGSIVYEKGGLVLLSVGISAATNYLVVWRCDENGDHYLSVNGGAEQVAAAVGDPGGQTGTLLCGGDGGNAGFAVCTIGEIWVCKEVAGAAEISGLHTYAQTAHGVAA